MVNESRSTIRRWIEIILVSRGAHLHEYIIMCLPNSYTFIRTIYSEPSAGGFDTKPQSPTRTWPLIWLNSLSLSGSEAVRVTSVFTLHVFTHTILETDEHHPAKATHSLPSPDSNTPKDTHKKQDARKMSWVHWIALCAAFPFRSDKDSGALFEC